MIYLLENGIIVTQFKEINYSKEYRDIKSSLEHSDVAGTLTDDTFIIFRVFKAYEGSEWDENDDIYEKVLYVCGVDVVQNPLEAETILTSESYDEQIARIYDDYNKKFKFDTSEVFNFPFAMRNEKIKKFVLVPIIFDPYAGTETEKEDEEEKEIFVTRAKPRS